VGVTIRATMLPVTDVEKAMRQYAAAFDVEVVGIWADDGPGGPLGGRVGVLSSTSDIWLYEMRASGYVPPTYPVLFFAVDDIEHARQRAESAGFTVITYSGGKEKIDDPLGTYYVLLDEDDNQLELREPAKTGPSRKDL
jgi:hypothetical protein